MAALKRLTKELHDMQTHKMISDGLILAGPKDATNIFEWEATMVGPQDSCYSEGVFTLSIQFPADYPFLPPQIKFITKIWHPNISDEGLICLDLLNTPEKWSPALSVMKVLLSIQSLLTEPNPEHGLQPKALDQFRKDKEKFFKKAKEYTLKYAAP